VLNERGKFGAEISAHYTDIVIFVLGCFNLNHRVQVSVGYLRLSAGASVSCLYASLSDVVQATTAGAIVLLVLLTILIIIITVLSFVCLKRTRRWPFSGGKCRMVPNVLYTAAQPASANDPFLPFDAAAAAGNDAACNRKSTFNDPSLFHLYCNILHHHHHHDAKTAEVRCDDSP